MTSLVTANTEYYTIPDIGSTTTCMIEACFIGTAAGSGTRAIVYRHSSDRFYIARSPANTILFGHGAAFFDTGIDTNDALHTASLEYTGTHVIGVVDGVEVLNTTTTFTGLLDDVGVGRRDDVSSFFFEGIIINVKVVVNGSIVRYYKLDETWDGPSTVAVDSISGQDGTSVNITSSDAQNYTFDGNVSPNTWTGDDATVIEVAGT